MHIELMVDDVNADRVHKYRQLIYTVVLLLVKITAVILPLANDFDTNFGALFII